MTLSLVDKVEARSSVELENSCNCNECCPRTCCFPWRVRKVEHKHAERQPEIIEITPTAIKVHSASEPTLTASGAWEIEIDGKKHSLSENAIGEAIKAEHGIPK